MARYALLLATELAGVAVGNGSDADVNGWVAVPPGAQDMLVGRTAANGADFTPELEWEDLNGNAHSLDNTPFAADGEDSIYLGSLPIARIRERISAYTAGDLSTALHFNA